MPKGVQLRRIAGWRKPPGAVKVARPMRWGNPFKIDDCIESSYATTEDEARAVCVEAYRAWLASEEPWENRDEERRDWILTNLPTLAGKDLMCFCRVAGPGEPYVPCHRDVLLVLANPGLVIPGLVMA
jgi:hypothetical protein